MELYQIENMSLQLYNDQISKVDYYFQLDAYPPVVTFSWFFNNSDHKDELDEERFTTDGKVSTLNFTPTNNQDYGTLYCEGQNVIGHQEEPCTFQIVPTG